MLSQAKDHRNTDKARVVEERRHGRGREEVKGGGRWGWAVDRSKLPF